MNDQPPDYSLLLRFLPTWDEASNEDRYVHVTVKWDELKEGEYGLHFSCDVRKPPENGSAGGWDEDWSWAYDVPEKAARALHAYLGFILSRVDIGELSSSEDKSP